jgi:tetrahydrodipicolinate N-succinyltransferase
MINDNTKPVIFLGSNSALWYYKDLFAKLNITVHGLIDSDYFGNTNSIDGIPVIDTEENFSDHAILKKYRDDFNFFLVINWTGEKNPVQTRTRQKRKKFIDLIELHDLPCVSIVDPTANVHPTVSIGKNVLIDAFVYMSGYNTIGDFTGVFAYAAIGHHNTIGKNCVIQRQAGIHVFNTLEDNVYVGLSCQVFGEGLTLQSDTIIHPCLAVNRSTKSGELVSLAGKDLRKIYPFIQTA